MHPPIRRQLLVRRRPIRWWLEILLVLVGYYVYAQARDAHGRAAGHTIATRHGIQVFHVERVLGLDIERSVQNFFLPHPHVVKLIGGFYGSMHFLLTAGVLFWLLLRRREVYRFWRTVLFVTSFVAVGLFALYPTLPPRLFPQSSPEWLLDTMGSPIYGGLWSYNRGVMEHIADPYAAMPSLHLGWGMWVGMVIFTQVRSRLRYVGLVYPIVTIFAVMITGTHFFLDTIAGCALFAVVFTVVAAAYSWRARRSFAAEPVESFGDRDAPSAERIPA